MLLISVIQQQQQQQFISTTATTTIYFIFTSKETHNFSKRIQFLNRFNESPLKLRKTQLVLIDVISQLVAGINSTLLLN